MKNKIEAANRAPIEVYGAVLLRLEGTDKHGTSHKTAALVYVSPDSDKF